MTEKPSRRSILKGVAATGTAATGLAAFGGQAAAQTITDATAVQRGAGLVLVQLQVTDAVDIGSVVVSIEDNEVVKNVGNNNNITIPIQVSGNQVGATVDIAILGATGDDVITQTQTTVTEQTTGQSQ